MLEAVRRKTVTREEFIERSASNLCPCCGQRMPQQQTLIVDLNVNRAMYNGLAVYMRPQAAEILSILKEHYPRFVTIESLIILIWQDKEPDFAHKSLQVQVCLLRKQLKLLGWGIRTIYGGGYQLVKL